MNATYRSILAAARRARASRSALAACGDDDERQRLQRQRRQRRRRATASAIESDPANACKGTITVGSKNFAEQYILGEIYAQALEAAGFKVKKQLDLGSEQVAFKALQERRHRRVPGVHGHGADVVLQGQDRRHPARHGRGVRAAQGRATPKDNITALPQTPFQNTFVITSTKETAEKLGNPKTITELAEKAPELSISGFPECRQRTDCLLGLQQRRTTGSRSSSPEGKFEDLDQGQSDFTFGFGTDGELALRQVRHLRGRQAALPAVLHHVQGPQRRASRSSAPGGRRDDRGGAGAADRGGHAGAQLAASRSTSRSPRRSPRTT